MNFALRIDDCLEDVVAWLNRVGYGGFGVREHGDGGENQHWHFLLDCPAGVKIQAVRTALNRAVPALKGNGKYSLSEVKDLEKYERYMCKGESEGEGCEVVWRNSLKYTEDKIEELHVGYWEENKKLKKRSRGSMIDYVVDEAKRQNVAWDQREKLAKIYIKGLSDLGKPINLFSGKANLNAVQVALCPDDSAVDLLAGHLGGY